MGVRVPEGRSWSLDVPLSWSWEDGSPAISFLRDDGVGALLVSAHGKSEGEVTFFDLMSTASERVPEHVQLEACEVGDFSGLTVTIARPEGHSREWWLRAGPTLLYVTQICSHEDAGVEDAEVDAVLATLRDERLNPTPSSWDERDDDDTTW
jgi:hypothetical protein